MTISKLTNDAWKKISLCGYNKTHLSVHMDYELPIGTGVVTAVVETSMKSQVWAVQDAAILETASFLCAAQ